MASRMSAPSLPKVRGVLHDHLHDVVRPLEALFSARDSHREAGRLESAASTAFRAILNPLPSRRDGHAARGARGAMSSGSLPLYEMRRTWALVDMLTSVKRRANHPPPTAELIRRKFDTLPMPALDTLSILVDQTIAEQHGRLGQGMVCGMARAVRSFPEATAAEVAIRTDRR